MDKEYDVEVTVNFVIHQPWSDASSDPVGQASERARGKVAAMAEQFRRECAINRLDVTVLEVEVKSVDVHDLHPH